MLKPLSPVLAAALLVMPAAAGAEPGPAKSASAQHGRAVGQKTVVDIAVGSPVHTTLVAAVQAAGLVDTLSGRGPFTLFAPVNDAFADLPAGTVETLLKPENKGQLTSVLTYHVVPGRVTAAQLTRMIRRGGGHARLATVAGGQLVARAGRGGIVITDEQGRRTRVAQADLRAANGVIHVTDGVFLPR